MEAFGDVLRHLIGLAHELDPEGGIRFKFVEVECEDDDSIDEKF